MTNLFVYSSLVFFAIIIIWMFYISRATIQIFEIQKEQTKILQSLTESNGDNLKFMAELLKYLKIGR